MSARSIILGAAALTLMAGLSTPATAGAVADFYKGRQISLTHTGGAGGGFAIYTRVLAKHIAKHIPGNPKGMSRLLLKLVQQALLVEQATQRWPAVQVRG